MKNRLMFILLALMVLAITNTAALAGRDKKDKSCAGGCCGDKMIAMADMQMDDSMKHEHSKMKMDVKKDPTSQTMYTCSMHPEVKSSKPGDCPKCGMALVLVKSGKKSDPKSLMKKKLQLINEGKYNCCIEEPCTMCVEHGGCNCKNAVKNDKPVCGECYKGWEKGEGDVSGKTLKDIKKGEGHKH
jgi:hypothetical protein